MPGTKGISYTSRTSPSHFVPKAEELLGNNPGFKGLMIFIPAAICCEDLMQRMSVFCLRHDRRGAQENEQMMGPLQLVATLVSELALAECQQLTWVGLRLCQMVQDCR